MALLPQYRNKGIGDKLRNIPNQLGYDYIYGEQLHTLNNLDNWIRNGRRLVAKNNSVNVTLKDLK